MTAQQQTDIARCALRLTARELEAKGVPSGAVNEALAALCRERSPYEAKQTTSERIQAALQEAGE